MVFYYISEYNVNDGVDHVAGKYFLLILYMREDEWMRAVLSQNR